MKSKRAVIAGAALAAATSIGVALWAAQTGTQVTNDGGSSEGAAGALVRRPSSTGAEPAGATHSIRGQVVNAEGGPLAGAKVVAVAASDPGLSCSVCEQSAFECEAPETIRMVLAAIRKPGFTLALPLSETVSDGEGRFTLTALEQGLNGIVVTTADTTQRGKFELDTDKEEIAVLTLAPPTSYTISVNDSEQQPLADVDVVAFDPETNELHEGRTRADGTFTVTTASELLWLATAGNGWVPRASFVSRNQALVLSRPRTVIVHLVQSSRPIDAEISLSAAGENDDKHAHHARSENGVARFTGLPSATWSVTARKGNLVASPVQFDADPPVTEVTIELEPSGRLMVSVIDAAALPVAGVEAALVRNEYDDVGRATTASNGALLVFGPLPVGSYRLTLTPDLSEAASAHRSTARTVEITAGDTQIEMVLDLKILITGRVVAADGKPLIGASVRVVDELNLHSGNDTVTADGGVFELDVAERGSWQLLSQNPEGFAERVIDVPAPFVELKLDVRACVALTVDGIAPELVEKTMMMAQSFDGPAFSSERLLDARGQAMLCGLPSGQARISGYLEGYLPPDHVALVKAGQATPVRLTMVKASDLSGRVTDQNGEPVPGAKITSGEQLISFTGDHGESLGLFEFNRAGLGESFALVAQREGYEASAVIRVRAPSSGVVLQMRALPRLKGRIVSRASLPLIDLMINGERIPDEAHGRFIVSAEKTLLVTALNHLDLAYEVPKAATELGDLAVEPRPAIKGQVIDSSGQPVAAATIESVGFTGNGSVTSDLRGEFTATLEEPLAAPFPVTAKARRLTGTASFKPGDRIVIMVTEPTKVRGKVVGGDGRGMAASVFVSNRQEETRNAESGPDGTFTLELSEGPWQFSTRSSRIAQTVLIHGAEQDILLGTPPGTCGLIVQGGAALQRIRLLPAGAQLSDSDDALPAGAVELGPGFRANGLTCGKYMMVSDFETGQLSTAISLSRGEASVLVVAPPAEAPAPADGGSW